MFVTTDLTNLNNQEIQALPPDTWGRYNVSALKRAHRMGYDLARFDPVTNRSVLSSLILDYSWGTVNHVKYILTHQGLALTENVELLVNHLIELHTKFFTPCYQRRSWKCIAIMLIKLRPELIDRLPTTWQKSSLLNKSLQEI